MPWSAAEWERDQAKKALAELEQRVREFEEASGVRIGKYDRGPIAKAVRIVMEATDAEERARRTIAEVKRDLKNALDRVELAAEHAGMKERGT